MLGAADAAALRALVAADPARGDDDVLVHAAAPSTVGAGEDLAGALARLDGDGPVLVLVDGRAAALVARACLEQGVVAGG